MVGLMALRLRWVDAEDLDRVAETRWMCYGHALKDKLRYKERLEADPRGKPGDYLLAERNGQAVGTATSLGLRMWIRGTPFPCQCVAFVGTIKSARRQGGKEPGIASAVMAEVVRTARERGDVLSALMPFRVSFYEHFGYGVIERRAEWTIPLSTIRHVDCSGWRFITPADRPAQREQWQQSVQAGQCDIERSEARWKHIATLEEDGMVFVDRPDPKGPVLGYLAVTLQAAVGKNTIKVEEWSVNGTDGFVRMLAFLATMRDQFSAASITTPATYPINRLLREAQIPHRPVDHATSQAGSHTRMQARILDHRKFLESIHWPGNLRGRVTVAIAECEGHVSRLAIDLESGKAKVTEARGDCDFECTDQQWAAVATGDMSASASARWGLARDRNPAATSLLDALSAGPVPFCREFF
jgi:predicted acetyltransferase